MNDMWHFNTTNTKARLCHDSQEVFSHGEMRFFAINSGASTASQGASCNRIVHSSAFKALILTPSASACAIPNLGTLRVHNGMK